MAITIQYTDEGNEKIIGSDGQESENITIQWRQNRIDADVLKRVQRDPKIFTRSNVTPDQVEEETANYTATIDIDGSTLFTFTDDTALLSFTITDPNGENYTVNDSKLTWLINGEAQNINNNVYEISEEKLIDREVNIIKAVYEDEKVKVTDDITILKYMGYDASNIGDGGVDPEEDPNIVGGIIDDSPLIDTVAENGFEVGRTIRFYWKGVDASFIFWKVEGNDAVAKQKTFEWRPDDSGVYIIEALPFGGGFGEPAREVVKIVRNQTEFSGSGGSGNSNIDSREELIRNRQIEIR